MSDRPPLLSPQEIEALIQGWQDRGSGEVRQIDRFFPLRMWTLVLTALAGGTWILWNLDLVTIRNSHPSVSAPLLQNYLMFRGAFLLLLGGWGTLVYTRGFFFALHSLVILLVACVHLTFDLFIIFPAPLSQPTPWFTLALLLRLWFIWLMYLNLINVDRMPDATDRWNLFLPLKRLR